MSKFIPLLALVLTSVASVDASNWPHWRGENGNSVSSTATPPTKWTATDNVRWKVELPGSGSGSPVIWENRVFVTSAVPGQGDSLNFDVFCFDRATGKELWRKTATTGVPHEGTHNTNGFASASPCTDGEHVYAHFGSRGTFCYTLDGKLVWKRDDLGQMTMRGTFGEGSSPTIAGDKIIVPWDHEGPSSLIALNKSTGETEWRVDRDEPSCWATPLVIRHRGRDQIIMNGQNFARAYDLESGKELWRCSGQTQRPVACPVTNGEMVFVGSGFRGAFLGAFTPGGEGDIQGSNHVIWTVDKDTPDIASLLLSEDRLYYHKAKTAILTCVNAKTGQPHYAAQRLPEVGTLYASPVAAGGHIYVTDRAGKTAVIKDAEEFEVVGVNSVGETVDATPAPVDNELFIRGERHLFCIAE